MTRVLLLSLTLVFSAAWLPSQDASQTSAGQTGTAASAQGTLEGCLQGSDGGYTLTDKDGRIYQLDGPTSKIAAHVGHEVQVVTTTPASVAISSAAGAEESAAETPILTVKEVKHISGTCQAAGKQK